MNRTRRFTCDTCGWHYLAQSQGEEFPCPRCDGTCHPPFSDAEVTRRLNAAVKRMEREAKR